MGRNLCKLIKYTEIFLDDFNFIKNMGKKRYKTFSKHGKRV